MCSNSTSPGPRTGTRSRLVIGATIIASAATLGLSACGRSAPIDALSDVGADPDIAGVSVTSPDAVVTTLVAPVEDPASSTTAVTVEQVLHLVQPGDTMSGIASAYGVGVTELADYNGISNVDTLRPGQELAIPPQPVEPAGPAETETETETETEAEAEAEADATDG